jgi:hypothetical protein
MTIVTRRTDRLTDLADVLPLLDAENQDKALVYDHATRSFVLQAVAAPAEVEALADRLASLETTAPTGLLFLFDDGDTDSGDVEFVIG